MPPQPIKLVTIVCESALERVIAPRLLFELGAKGYTIGEVHGRGARGEQDARWSLSSNVRIEIVCEEATARRIVDTIFRRYSDHYGMIAWIADVEVSGFNF
ncbi:MAG: transcriptional regulator [Burkholderiaceae bacterium]|nr:transcriptional regulator [Burkholderiaceae bacterium]